MWSRAETRRAVHGSVFRRPDARGTAQQPINGGSWFTRRSIAAYQPYGGNSRAWLPLAAAGLALPVADSLKIPAAYSDIYHLMRDLRDMGETNIMTTRQKTFTAKSLFDRAQKIFATEFPTDEGRIACTFDLVFLSGWAPHASQPKALKPGSATKSLQQALEEAKSSLGN